MMTRRRVMFFMQLSIFGLLLNALTIQLPIVVPLLLGNVCFLALALRLGPIWGGFAFFMVLLPIETPLYWLSSFLQLAICWLLIYLRRPSTILAGLSYFAVLSPLALLFLPLNADFLMTVALLTFSFVVVRTGALMVVDLCASTHVRKQQSLQHQLSGRIATYATIPFGIIILISLHAAIVNDMAKANTEWSNFNFAVKSQIERQLSRYLATIETSVRYLDQVEHTNLIKDLVHSRPEFISALITDEAGVVTHFYKTFVDQDIRGVSVAFRPYFAIPKATGKPYISDVFQGQRMGKDLLFAVSAPFFKQDQFAGIIELSVSLAELQIDHSNTQGNQDFELLLLDHSEKTIWSSDPLLSRGVEIDFSLIHLDQQQDYFKDSMFNPGPPITLAKQAQLQLLRDPIQGSDWSLLLYANTKTQQVKYQAFVAVALLSLWFFMFLSRRSSAFFVRSYTETLTHLIQHMEEFTPETTAHPGKIQPLATTTEFERLANSFIHMQRRISYAHHQLQNVLAEKTQLSAELELRVQHRTYELQAERDRATRLANAKSQFLANMSHELRTPLAIISGYTAQLQKESQLAKFQQELQSIETSCHFLLGVVNDILDSAKLEEGKLKVSISATALWPFLQDIQLSVQGSIASKGLVFEFSCPEQLPEFIDTDAFRLKQILLNLLGNAMKFTHEGFIELHVSVEQQQLHLSVIDSGIGISSEQQQRIFEAFEQADISTTRQYGGSGLGLYICKKLTEQLGIGFAVSSQPGIGSRFTLQLPIADHTPWIRSSGSTQPLPASKQIKYFNAAVLVVEDVPELRRLFCQMLQEHGIQTTTAENGEQALQLLKTHAFDLIMMDLHMPIVDGAEALQALRALGFQQPVFILTADVQELKHQHLRQLGCQQVLTKPVKETELVQALATVLSEHAVDSIAHTQDNPRELQTDPYDELQRSFLDSLETLEQRLNSAVQQQQWDGLQPEMHKLKGTAACLDFAELSQFAAKVEHALKQQQPCHDAIVTLLQHIKQLKTGN